MHSGGIFFQLVSSQGFGFGPEKHLGYPAGCWCTLPSPAGRAAGLVLGSPAGASGCPALWPCWPPGWVPKDPGDWVPGLGLPPGAMGGRGDLEGGARLGGWGGRLGKGAWADLCQDIKPDRVICQSKLKPIWILS